jgi:hypothetical protein
VKSRRLPSGVLKRTSRFPWTRTLKPDVAQQGGHTRDGGRPCSAISQLSFLWSALVSHLFSSEDKRTGLSLRRAVLRQRRRYRLLQHQRRLPRLLLPPQSLKKLSLVPMPNQGSALAPRQPESVKRSPSSNQEARLRYIRRVKNSIGTATT